MFTQDLFSDFGWPRELSPFAGPLDFPPRVAAPARPAFDIVETGDDGLRVTIDVAGFDSDDLEVEAREGRLTVIGHADDEEDARRAFRLDFRLDPYMEVTGARHENGLLHVDLRRALPEALKPRRIEIKSVGHGLLAKAKDLIEGVVKPAA